jgi:hypothetical protein
VVILITCICENTYSANCYTNPNPNFSGPEAFSPFGRPRHGKPTTGLNY